MTVVSTLLRPPVYVCLCNGVTERDIREAATAGCSGMPELTMRTGCGACCGSCVATACEVLAQVQAEREASLPVVAETPAFEVVARAA